MYGYKHPLASLTVIASISAILGAVLTLTGTEYIGALWSGASSIVAIRGRFRASKRISDPAAGGS